MMATYLSEFAQDESYDYALEFVKFLHEHNMPPSEIGFQKFKEYYHKKEFNDRLMDVLDE
jgi:hypothetical protein